MNNDEHLARLVILGLRRFTSRIDEILRLLEDKRDIRRDEREELQSLLTSLKQDLKDAAKRGKIDAGAEPPSRFERAYFAPAVQSAAANFSVAVNSHPIRSDWFACLYGVRMDIDMLLHQLEAQYPNVETE